MTSPADSNLAIEKTQLRIKEISIRLDRLDREMDDVFSELGINPEQLHAYFQQSKHLSSTLEEEIHQERKRLDEKLELALQCIKDPLKLKKTFSERGSVKPHWLFVR